MGRVRGHFGVRGEVKVDAADMDAFSSGAVLMVGSSPSARRLRVASSRRHNKMLVVRFDGVETIDAARALAGLPLFVPRAELSALTGKKFRAIDLFGFDVRDRNLGSLGKVSGVRHYPACDMLVVGPDRILVPLLDAYGVTVNRRKKEIAVALPPGFEEL